VGHEVKSTMSKIPKSGEVSKENIQPITSDQLKDADKAKFEEHIKHMKNCAWLHMVRPKVGSSRRILI
jgi:hypothetical protein